MAPERPTEVAISIPRQRESSRRHHPYPKNNRSELRSADDTSGFGEESCSNKDVEEDRRILHEHKWELYKAVQEALEANLLMRLLLKSGNMSYSTCAACLKNQDDVRALLLEGWENGTFQALRSNSTFVGLSNPATHDKDTTMLLAAQEPMDVSPEESATTENTVPELDELGGKTLERTTGQALAQADEDDDHMDTESSRSEYGPVDGIPEETNVAKLKISRSALVAGRDIRVAVNIWCSQNEQIAEWFFDVVDYRAMHNEVAKKRSKSTGGWFLLSKAYSDRCTSPQQRIMWCPGIPGVGKTVMASLVVDHLRLLDESEIFIGVIYFNYKLRSEQSKLAILEAICRQMFELREHTALEDLYDSNQKWKSRPTEAELQSALSNALRDYKSCYLVLDALDEYTAHYNDSQVREVIKDILSLGVNVKLLITSRILGEMEAMFKALGASREEIIADDVDMSLDVTERVQSLKSRLGFTVSGGFSEHIVEKVIEAAKGRFLVAELGVNLLAEQLNLGDLEDALNKLPKEIDETYIRVMELIKSYPESRRELAMKALMWIAYARRRLSVRELPHALATKNGRTETGKYVTPLSTITGLCVGLIVVEAMEEDESDDERIVRFVRFTTQEFFGAQSDYFRNAHKDMFSTCTEYLSTAANCTPSEWDDICATRRSSPLPFYDYAALNWGHHANTHHESLHEEVRECLFGNDQALELSWDYTLRKLYPYYDYSYGHEMTKTSGAGASLAAYHNQLHALGVLLDQMDTIPCTLEQRTPMHIAVIGGWTNAAKEMLRWSGSSCNSNEPRMGSDIPTRDTMLRCGNDFAFLENVRDVYGRTPLSYAAEKGEESIAQHLLEHRFVEVDLKDEWGRTPFSYAAQKDKELIAKLLLEREVESGKESTVKLLLEHGGVDPDSKDKCGQTPLSKAAQSTRPNESIVKFLLEHGGVEADSKDNYGYTPLTYAAEEGMATIVRLLLEHGVEADSKNSNGRTPLSHAAAEGKGSVVKFLLDHGGVDVNSKDNDGWTPLMHAVKSVSEQKKRLDCTRFWAIFDPRDIFDYLDNRERWESPINAKYCGVVELLLEGGGIEVNAKDNNGWTAFGYAVRDGETSIIKLLLGHGGVEVDSKDNDGRSPLSYAAEKGMDSVVKLLLEHGGIDVNSKDNNGRTPFSYAAENGGYFYAEPLLEHGGIDVDSKDNSGRTAFSYAAQNSGNLFAEPLLGHEGIDVDSKDNNGRTPLSYAAEQGGYSIVKLLLEQGSVEADSKDLNGRTPLSYAAQQGKQYIIKLLLEHGDIEVNSKDNNGRTPLSYAAEMGRELTVELLRRQGAVEVSLEDLMFGSDPLFHLSMPFHPV